MIYDLEFATADEAAAHLDVLGFKRVPSKFYTHAANGYDDDGRKTVTAARLCYGAGDELPIKWQFHERAAR